MNLLHRRLARLARTGSPRLIGRAFARELVATRDEAGLDRAARTDDRILVGPFIGEVGYELLYWLPFVRRLLRDRGIERDRVTVLARGGAGSWYEDIASSAVEILDLVDSDRYRAALLARRARAGDAKQLRSDAFDRELLARALVRVGPAHVVHPRLMYARLRFVWEGLEPPERAAVYAEYRGLARVTGALPREAVLPERFVAVKAYFSDVLPDSSRNRAILARLVARLAEWTDVVVLANSAPPDEHEEWRGSGARVIEAASWLAPRDNLAVQSEIVSAADALLSTYGGFAYLGPLLGVRTIALHAATADNPRHLVVADTVLPGPALEHVRLDGMAVADEIARRLAGVAAT